MVLGRHEYPQMSPIKSELAENQMDDNDKIEEIEKRYGLGGAFYIGELQSAHSAQGSGLTGASRR